MTFIRTRLIVAYEAFRAVFACRLLQLQHGDTIDVFQLPQTFPEVVRARAKRIGACIGEGVRATGHQNASELECPYSEQRTSYSTAGANTAMPHAL